MKKTIIVLLMICLIWPIGGCGKSSSKGASSQSNSKTIAFATKQDLFNQLENVIKKLPEKKYSDAYSGLNEIFKLSNKSGLVSDPKDKDSDQYILNLNLFAADIFNESKIEKERKVAFDYEKSQLALLSSTLSQGQSQSQGSGGSQSGGASGGSSSKSGSAGSSGNASSGSSGGSSGGGSSSSSEGGQNQQGQQNQNIILPEQELIEKYPELTLTEKDRKIFDRASDLMGYVSKVALESEPENESAITNREKYLMYKIKAQAALNQYVAAKEFLLEAKNMWDKLYIKIPEENQKEVITYNALLKNIESSLTLENHTAIEIQTKIAVEMLNTLTSKQKSS